MLKKIDKLLVKSFLPPFFLTFFIALFVLIMSTIWTYVDEIAGKGADIFILSEFVFYLSISLFPMALPIAVLISSVMVMGNLAERYELTSIKSAGIPLLRTMAPLMVVCFGISLFSYFCANKLIPVANLQFKTRLFDIRRHKPMLNLEQGVFNDDFNGFTMFIGEKGKDGKSIKDVLIYDHNRYNQDAPPRILAESGEMFSTEDNRYFVMNLYDGNQYREVQEKVPNNEKKYPFTRLEFKKWSKVFDLSEFNIDESDRRGFKSHYKMLSRRQLAHAIDSLDTRIENKFIASFNLSSKLLTPYKEEMKKEFIKEEKINLDSYEKKKNTKPNSAKESAVNTSDKKPTGKSVNISAGNNKTKEKLEKDKKAAELKLKRDAGKKKLNEGPKKRPTNKTKPYKQKIDSTLSSYPSIIALFEKNHRRNLRSKAKTMARNSKSQIEANRRSLDRFKETRVKHIYELHSKFTLAIACFIFLFIGAPMGAIIRKGGFGFPILIAIVFFILFTVLNMLFKKIAETFVIEAVLATWMPVIIIFPIGVFLTSRAMSDKKVVDFDLMIQSISGLFKNFFPKKNKIDKINN